MPRFKRKILNMCLLIYNYAIVHFTFFETSVLGRRNVAVEQENNNNSSKKVCCKNEKASSIIRIIITTIMQKRRMQKWKKGVQ